MLKRLLKHFYPGKLGIIILGSLTWVLTTFKSGLGYDFGLGFWGPHGHDGIWHIALAQSLARGSFQMPVFVGSLLQNYHIGYDLLLALFNRITQIPIITLYFQILPPIVAFLIGFLTYKFVLEWKKSKTAAWWSTFFVYFGGSWGWLINLIRGQEIGGESMFWSQQAISTLINPPFALSLVFVLLGLISLQKKKLLFAIICFGLLSQVKAYAFVLVIGGLLVSGQWKAFLGSTVLGLLLFLPLNKNSTGLLVWHPFWFLETMMGLSDRFHWPKFYEGMMNYKLADSPKLFIAYPVALAIFWFGNLGTRVIKEIHFLKTLKNSNRADWFSIMSLSIIAAGIVIPTFFLQAGTPWNTIQFLYYSLFFSSILAGAVIGETKLKPLLGVLLILLTIPTSVGTLRHYLPSRPPAMLPENEQEALKFLSEQPEGVVLTYPFDKIKADAAVVNPPRPLYLYESTAYVSAFSNKLVYLEDQVNLDIMQYDWKSRKAQIEQFYASLDQEFVRQFLRGNNITYIYWVKPQRATLGETQLGLEKIFENQEVDIYKVLK